MLQDKFVLQAEAVDIECFGRAFFKKQRVKFLAKVI